MGDLPVALAEEQAASPESFTFSEQSAPTAAPSLDLARANNLAKRSAPVSSSGTFTHSVRIDVPPGRLTMTPNVSLSYSSGAHREEHDVGAGWSLSGKVITRSTQKGFPPVVQVAGGSLYDDTTSVFEGPDGPMISDADGPKGARGTLYAPVREYSPVRYEHIVNVKASRYWEDRWIEHHPSGIKRYYGALGSMPNKLRGRGSAIAANELGIHTWYLLEEVDALGNNISYKYHLGSIPNDRKLPRQRPVIASISWGGNTALALPHVFELRTVVSAKAGELDMLHGHVRSDLRIDAIEVRGPAPTSPSPNLYWRYDLYYERSTDSGRQLLSHVMRSAPVQVGQPLTQFRDWWFSYSSNPSGVQWDASGQDLPASMKGAYVDFYVNPSSGSVVSLTPGQKFLLRSNPTDSRSATKFVDFDGNGTLDSIYHAAGLTRPDVAITKEQSYLQASLGVWQSLQLAPPADLYDYSVTEFVDVDRDSDLDAVAFPSTTFTLEDALVVEPTGDPDEPNTFDGFCSKVSNSCCANALTCGAVFTPLNCTDSECPYIEGLEAVVYPSDLIDQIAGAAPLQAGPATAIASPAPRARRRAASASGGFCGAGTALCNTYYNATRFDFCRTPTNACAYSDPTCASFCNLQFGRQLDGISIGLTFFKNPARCAQGNCNTSELVTLDHWPRTARQWTDTRRVEDPQDPQKPPELYPEIVGTFYAPFADINADGLPDLVLIKQSDNFLGKSRNTYLPRVYLSRGTSTVTDYKLDTTTSLGLRFTDALRDILANTVPEPCYALGDRLNFHPSCSGKVLPYPRDENFNTFVMDVNGDALPDLVTARPPVAQTCSPGHNVFLNTGYGWEEKGTWSLGRPWSAENPSAALTSHPFRLLRNYQRTYKSLVTASRGTCAQNQPPPLDQPPMSAMSQTDVNADGRLDVVFAYQPRSPAPAVQLVYLNSASGFQLAPASRFVFPQVQYGPSSSPRRTFAFAIDPLVGTSSTSGVGDAWLHDMGRMVDVDSDGLVDLVTPGSCTRPTNLGVLTTGMIASANCRPPRWHRNLSVAPDLLTSATTSGGDFVRAQYVAANSPAGRLLVTGDAAPGFVVSRIERAAGPIPAETPIETIDLLYRNFVRDTESSEAIGFTEVEATFTNRFGTTPTETLTMTHRYDVNRTLAGLATTPFPLKGMATEVLAASGTDIQRTRSRYFVAALGKGGARIRPSGSDVEECSGYVCTSTGKELLRFDAYGNPQEAVAGNFASGSVVLDNERVRSTAAFENRADARWTIGLRTDQVVYGYSEDIDGRPSTRRVLSSEGWTYYPSGLLWTTTRRGVIHAACKGTVRDSIAVNTYYASGLLQATWENNARTIELAYDANQLHPFYRRTMFTQFWDGAATQSLTTLIEFTERDPRHGNITDRTGLNGIRRTSAYDSFGRPYDVRGPSGVLLESTTYADTYPLSSTTTVATDTGRTFLRKAHLDGSGREIAVVEEGAGTQTVRSRRAVFDAFGRAIWIGLPRFAVSLDDIALNPAEQRRTNVFDGFDRLLQVTQVDGQVRSYAYVGREVTETNPRRFQKRREYDGNRNLVRLSDHDASGTVLATTQYVRDGAGKQVRIVDGDGNVRRIERDGVGQVARLTLPHAPGSTPAVFSVCRDLDGQVVSATTPHKTISVVRDALGRAVRTTAASGTLVTTVLQTYDDPSTNAQGQLSRVVDDTGVTKFRYDDWGRPAAVEFEPSPRMLSGLPVASALYRTDITYDRRGNVLASRFQGVPGNVGVSYGRDVKGRTTSVETTGVTGPVTLASVKEYDSRDRAIEVVFGNGTSARWTYPAHQRLENLTHYDSTRGMLAAFDYTYDANGNVETERYRQSSAPFWEKSHVYDAQDRLGTTALTWPSGHRNETHAFTPSGNVRTAVGETYSYRSVENAQAVTEVSGASGTRTLSYDRDGQLQSDVWVGGVNAASRLIGYHPTGCMASVEEQEASGVTSTRSASHTFLCNHEGTRVMRETRDHLTGSFIKRVDIPSMGELRAESNTLLLRLNVNGAVFAEEARSLTSGDRVAKESGYLHSDLRGSVVARTDYDRPGTAVSREAAYDAWGAPVAVSSNPFPSHGFVGSEADPGTGFQSFGRRSYDPRLRRWLSPDPLLWGNPEVDVHGGQQLNLYAYANNNPASYTDQSGLVIETVVDVASVIAGLDSISQWNANTSTFDKVLDVGGVVVDVAAVVLPGIPGGVGLGAKALRASEKVADGVKAVDKAVDTGKAAEKTAEVAQAVDKGHDVAATADKGKDTANAAKGDPSPPNFDKAREAAFQKAGMTDPSNVQFSKVDPETGTVVEFKGGGGAKVGYDGPHKSPGPHHDKQHISWQSEGKRGSGGAQRGNEPYSGAQHPSRSDRKQ